jgi:hypothetical protein
VPYVQRIAVSIDALGAVNKQTRGIDGDVIFRKMIQVHEFIAREKLGCELLTLSVVTTSNLSVIENLARKIAREAPCVKMAFAIAAPYTSDLSLARDKRTLSQLLASIAKLRSEGLNVVMCDRVVPCGLKEIPRSSDLNVSPIENGEVARRVRCRRQFFLTNVLPSGEIWRCKPNQFLHEYETIIRNSIAAGKYGRALRWGVELIDKLFIRPYNDVCSFPCLCSRYIDDVINAGNVDDVTGTAAKNLASAFDRSEIARVDAFLKRKYGKGLSPEVASFLVRESDSSAGR